jgi:hypothetical protein
MADPRSFPGVPLLGQPVEVLGWTLVINVRCKCDRPGLLMLTLKQGELGQNADLGICPHCARPMHLAQMRMTDHGLLEFGLQMGEPSRPATDAAAAHLTN